MKIIKSFLNYRRNVNKYSTSFTGFLSVFTLIFLLCAIGCCVLVSKNGMPFLLLAFFFISVSLAIMYIFKREINKSIKSGVAL